MELARTGDEEADVRENTARFARVIEGYVRAYPDQWLWVHKRWKTRPPGEKSIYPLKFGAVHNGDFEELSIERQP